MSRYRCDRNGPFGEVLADEGFDALLAQRFLIISSSRSVSLPEWRSAP
jgi:hypothetical protein